MTISRRTFLTGAGLTLAVAATPVGLRFFAGPRPDAISEALNPSIWVTITPDNQVTVVM